ncbi:hypothetical protein [Gaetbulibacter saemankumensis]|uniref:hypothetical protein n=1 Tax=Gaetbulibacter saemankumensis TaxID=311208 RepID=UPI0003FEBA2F|nr:hypothetical protein [Gaetbulibacter saemankumensis]
MNKPKVIFENSELINANVSYSEVANAFLTSGYTSAAGNTYFNSFRMAAGILIKEDIGEGYARTFLNGIKIYSIKDKTLIADITFHSVFYSKFKVKSEAKKMLMKFLEDAAIHENTFFDRFSADRIIEKVINEAMNNNQQSMVVEQMGKYLSP